MKNIWLAVAMAISLAACATSQESASDGAEASGSSAQTGRKKVCKYERSSGTGSRMERVCRFVDAG